MDRVKNFDATGIAPGGKLYAGDLNAIQDAAAGLYELDQNLGVASIAIGEAGLILNRFGVSEARISGAFRTDGIIRGLGGLYAGAFTTATRNAIGAGLAPYGLAIINTDTNRWEWNKGTDGARNWAPFSAESSQAGILSARPAFGAVEVGTFYYATDVDVLYRSTGAAWQRIGSQPGDLHLTFNDAASTGRILAQGQAWPSTTGIYAELFAKIGAKYPTNLPDMRARVPVILGTHADHDAIGDHDNLAVNNRRMRHQHTDNLTVDVHTHSDGTLAVASHDHGGGSHTHYESTFTGSIESGTGSGNYNAVALNAQSPQTSGPLQTVIAAQAPDVTGATGNASANGISGVVGPNTGAEPVDTISYLTLQGELKL